MIVPRRPSEKEVFKAGWKKLDKRIEKTFEFADFLGAIKFVDAVAKMAEKMQHHPDIQINYNKVLLSLTTHSAGGLTDRDFALAEEAEKIYRKMK